MREYNRRPGARQPGPPVPPAPEVLVVERAADGRVLVTRTLHGATIERLTLSGEEVPGVLAMLVSVTT